MRLARTEGAWALAECAIEPYFNLVQRYVFAPYFAGTLAATAAAGASVWGVALGAAGLAIALLAPLLGSIADSGGRLRPWLMASSLTAFVASASLWWAAPGSGLWTVAAAVAIGLVAVELLNMFVNASLSRAAARDRLGMVSSVGYAMSQVAGIAALLLILVASSTVPALLPQVPAAVDRMAGPAAALFLLLVVPPLLLLPEPAAPGRLSPMAGLRALKATLAEAWRVRDMRLFLLGRMLAADGMTVVFSFGAVLAAASFGWGADTMVVFGFIITVFGVVGGFLGAWLDPRLGSHRLMLLGLLTLMVGTASVILTDEARLVGIPTGVALSAPLASPQELGFLGSGAVVAIGAGFTLGAMRAVMAQLAPPAKMAAYFGLYAFVGKATAFVGPFLVSAIAAATGTVRLGILVAVVFLALGFLLLSRVRVGATRQFAG
jgi:UMF1 family MFS transporter